MRSNKTLIGLVLIGATVALGALTAAHASPSIHDPFRERGHFTVKNLVLEGAGPDVSLQRGGVVQGRLDFKYHCRDCGGAINQIIVGIAGEPRAQACVYSGFGMSGPWKTARFQLDIPDRPGTYEIRARYAQANDCRGALGWWRVDRPNGPGPRATVGIVTVSPPPPPPVVAPAPPPTRRLRVIREDMDRALTELGHISTQLSAATAGRMSQHERRRARRLSARLADLSQELGALKAELDDALRRRRDRRHDAPPSPPRGHRPPPVAPAPAPALPAPLSAGELDQMIRRVDKAIHPSHQKAVVDDYLRDNAYFLTHQAVAVVRRFAHDHDRVDVAVKLCDAIVEDGALLALLDTLRFENQRRALRERTRNQCGYTTTF